MLIVQLITVSTRPGRVGPAITAWVQSHAKRHAGFTVVVSDLADINLPVFDEPHHPHLHQYEHHHTKHWSAAVNAADAFVFVMPEYNYFVAPSLVNAIDYLAHEWNYKPAALVSYGGISGGVRAAQSAKALLTTVKVMPIPEAVVIPFVTQSLNEDKSVFTANDTQETAVVRMLDELHKWATVLQPLHS